VSRTYLINVGTWASACFNVGKPVDFRPAFGIGKLKRRERRAPERGLQPASTPEPEIIMTNNTTAEKPAEQIS
jgi:hypothetical protein